MIDPYNITNYNRTDIELEEFILFAICVAGKTAKQIAKALDIFFLELDFHKEKTTPFNYIKFLIEFGYLQKRLEEARLGQYRKLTRAFTELIYSDLELRTCSIEELERIHGISSKTSRYFILHSRPKQKIAVLDTHILDWMGKKGYDVPKSTPSSKKKYKELEQEFIRQAEKMGVPVADLDLKIWNEYSR